MPKYIAIRMLGFGPDGVARLVKLYRQARRVAGHTAVLTALYSGSTGVFGPIPFLQDMTPAPHVDEPTAGAARRAYRGLVLSSHADPDDFFYLISFINSESVMSQGNAVLTSIVEVIRDSTIRINQELIDHLRILVEASDTPESHFQAFLEANPVFLDPLAQEVIPKHTLGTEYVTDFVIRTLADRYVMVEIEKASDKVFTKSADFSAAFTHAVGQILDFQEWIESHVEYAQSRLPGITSPAGLLVMGRAEALDERARSKLRRFNQTVSNRLRVATYDDILADAERLHRNLIR